MHVVWCARSQVAPSLLSLGQGLKDDPLIQQRMWEALYPVRFSDTDTRSAC